MDLLDEPLLAEEGIGVSLAPRPRREFQHLTDRVGEGVHAIGLGDDAAVAEGDGLHRTADRPHHDGSQAGDAADGSATEDPSLDQ